APLLVGHAVLHLSVGAGATTNKSRGTKTESRENVVVILHFARPSTLRPASDVGG
ncbi:MAG: hypothetical protein QOC56_971, partial [Alphaproteobacteria bacterium]|nr:hypothetical protein [Alphaproteobacteria bacterium]